MAAIAGSGTSGSLGCEACAMVANSAEQLRQHLASSRHLNRLEELKLDPNAPLVPRTKRPRKEGGEVRERREGGEVRERKEPSNGETKADISCDICSLKFTGSSQLEAHMAGKKHKQKAEGHPEVAADAPEESSSSSSAAPAPKKAKIIFCSVCSLSFNHQGQYEKHLTGKRHLAGGVKPQTNFQKGARPGQPLLQQPPSQRYPPLIGAGGGAYNPAVYGYPPYGTPAPRPFQQSYSPSGSGQRYPGASPYSVRGAPALSGHGGHGVGSEEYTAVFVFHVSPTVDEPHLEELFKPFGQLHSIKVARDSAGTSKGYAFVNYLRYEEAQQAIKAMNGYPLDGKYLKVTLKS